MRYLGHMGYMGTWTDAQGEPRADGELRAYLMQFLANYFDLVAVTNKPVAYLREYIADLAVRDAAFEESTPINLSTAAGRRSFEELVQMISPRSRMKPGIVFVQTRLPEVLSPSTPPAQYRPPGVPEPVVMLQLPRLIPATYAPPPKRTDSWRDAEGRWRPDSELESYAWSYLNNFYVLRPMGSESIQQLKERIMYAFLRHQGVTSSGATFDSEIGPITMDEVVQVVSPLSIKKATPVASPDIQIAIRNQGVIPALTRPAAGKVPVKADWTQLFALLESGMVGYANAQKQAAAAQLMAIQKSGQPLYVDPRTAKNMAKKDNTLLYAGLGAVVLLGGLFLMLRD